MDQARGINLLVGVRNEAVRLDVSLVAHPQPERIAEVVPGGERDAACPISRGEGRGVST